MTYALRPLGQTPIAPPVAPLPPSRGLIPPVFRTGPGRVLYNAASPYIGFEQAVRGYQGARLANPPIAIVGVGMTALGLAAITAWVTGRAKTRVKIAGPLLVVAGWGVTSIGVAGLGFGL